MWLPWISSFPSFNSGVKKRENLQGQGGDGSEWGRGKLKLKHVSPGQGRQESEDSLLGFPFCSQIQMRREGSKKT